MLTYPDINPVAISLGPFAIHWYGLMYLLAFVTAWLLGRRRIQRLDPSWGKEQISELVFYAALGVIIGGRVGYVLFYDFAAVIAEPVRILKLWEGGMSFHGGVLGVMVALWLFSRRFQKHFFDVADFVVPLIPIGLGLGRLGNFINNELWGRVTEAPWGMVFPGAGPLPRHPSQLYEFLLEGVILFIALWWYTAKPRPRMAASGWFLVGYGVFRFIVECFREPDAHLGFILFNWVTLGQLLTVPLVLFGITLLVLAYQNHPQASSPLRQA